MRGPTAASRSTVRVESAMEPMQHRQPEGDRFYVNVLSLPSHGFPEYAWQPSPEESDLPIAIAYSRPRSRATLFCYPGGGGDPPPVWYLSSEPAIASMNDGTRPAAANTRLTTIGLG
jgi:hypothetical protein